VMLKLRVKARSNMVSVIMLTVVMLNCVMMNVVMLSFDYAECRHAEYISCSEKQLG
jgi:hypothetical protein